MGHNGTALLHGGILRWPEECHRQSGSNHDVSDLADVYWTFVACPWGHSCCGRVDGEAHVWCLTRLPQSCCFAHFPLSLGGEQSSKAVPILTSGCAQEEVGIRRHHECKYPAAGARGSSWELGLFLDFRYPKSNLYLPLPIMGWSGSLGYLCWLCGQRWLGGTGNETSCFLTMGLLYRLYSYTGHSSSVWEPALLLIPIPVLKQLSHTYISNAVFLLLKSGWEQPPRNDFKMVLTVSKQIQTLNLLAQERLDLLTQEWRTEGASWANESVSLHLKSIIELPHNHHFKPLHAPRAST